MLNKLYIIDIAETHLYGDQNLDLSGYTWYGKNNVKHIEAKKSVGGIGFFAKKKKKKKKHTVLDNLKSKFNQYEGKLWLQFISVQA